MPDGIISISGRPLIAEFPGIIALMGWRRLQTLKTHQSIDRVVEAHRIIAENVRLCYADDRIAHDCPPPPVPLLCIQELLSPSSTTFVRTVTLQITRCTSPNERTIRYVTLAG